MPDSSISRVAKACSMGRSRDQAALRAGRVDPFGPASKRRIGFDRTTRRPRLNSCRGVLVLQQVSLRRRCNPKGAADTRVYAKDSLKKLLVKNSEFSNVWANHLAQELQGSRLRWGILSLRTVAERLDAWIAWNDGNSRRRASGNSSPARSATSPEALYREIAKRRVTRHGSDPKRIHGNADAQGDVVNDRFMAPSRFQRAPRKMPEWGPNRKRSSDAQNSAFDPSGTMVALKEHEISAPPWRGEKMRFSTDHW